MSLTVEPADRAVLLRLARESIAAYLAQGPRPERPGDGGDVLEQPCGAFVTLHRDGQLRGCIGHMQSDDPLWKTIRHVAVLAASQDHRFMPVGVDELPAIDIEISVLSPMTPCPGVEQIRIGEHGLYLIARGRHGVLLPQVPVEWGWDVPTFLSHLCQKAGVPDGAWQDDDAELLWYTATVFAEGEPQV